MTTENIPAEDAQKKEDMNTSNVDNSVETLKQQIEEMEKRLAAVDNKNKELLSEKRKKDEEKRAAEEELEKERLRKSGEIDKLLEIEKQKTEAATAKANELLQKFREKEVAALAMSMANEMRGRPESIDLLADCVVKEIKDLVDEDGKLSDTKRKIVIQNFIDSAKYKPLLLGNLSTGGGAEGSGGSATKTLDEMSESEQISLFKSNPEKWRQLKAASGKK